VPLFADYKTFAFSIGVNDLVNFWSILATARRFCFGFVVVDLRKQCLTLFIYARFKTTINCDPRLFPMNSEHFEIFHISTTVVQRNRSTAVSYE
jgi:hypothetical protein